MSRSTSHNRADLYGRNALEHDPRFGIDPAVLLSSGILRDPAVPEQASLRAKSLIEAGRFREARSILQPHTHCAPGPLRARIVDQLAQCAMYGGGDWQTQLSAALDIHAENNSLSEIALTHQRLGEMLLLRGEFAEADKHFISADRIFSTLVDPGKIARVGALRARLLLRAGRAESALMLIDETLQRLGDREPRARAFAKLERARIQACRGRDDDAARELIAAEGVLGVSSNAADRLQTRLVRAEALIVLGDIPRAIKGLRRLLAEIRTGEPVGAAFDSYASRTGLPTVSRFAQAIAVAIERGTPLADVLHAQAADVREVARRELIESAARKEIAMMVPVVFLVLPVTVVFAFYPGLVGLHLSTS